MKLIDADEIRWADHYDSDGNLSKYKVAYSDEMPPTVDAMPVRHGKWLDPEAFKRPWFRHHIFECSVCRNTLDMDGVNAGRGDANYCPNCGAKMEAERKEE